MGDPAEERDRREAVAELATGALEGNGRRLAAEAVAAVNDALSAPAAVFEPGPDGPERIAGRTFDGVEGLAVEGLAGQDPIVANEDGGGAVIGPPAEPRGVVCVGEREPSEGELEFLGDVATVLERAWSGEKFRQFAEHLDEVVWMSSPEIDEIHYINPAYEEIWGRSRESLYADPTSFLEGVHPEDRERVRGTIPQRARGEYEEVYQVVRPDGSVRWVRDRAYPIREGGEVRWVAGIVEDVTDRQARERLTRLCQEVTHLVIGCSEREELEGRVCERLVAGEGYRFVWIGDLKPDGTRIVSRVSAGVEDGYLDVVTITDDDADTADGPTGRAIATGEVQVVSDIAEDPSFEPWRDEALERGYHSSVSVPITYEGLLYGLLNVYASRPDAFPDPTIDTLAGLGDVIGHAIAAIERKDALAADTTLELELRIEGALKEMAACTRETGGSIRLDHLSRREDAVVAYGTARGVPEERLHAAANDEERVETVRILVGGGEDYEFELRTADRLELVETLADHGGRVDSMAIEDGRLRLVIALPSGIDVRKVVDSIEALYPETDYVAKRTTTREPDALPHDVFAERLTKRQREVIEMATYAGYFEWPRATTGEEIAEQLGIVPATFAQHLRAAQRKLFEAMFDRE